MALATQCPHCGTVFRVAADQLKLRGGIVRCGACTQVFDGSAALVDLDAAPPAPLPADAASAAPASPAAPAAPATPAPAAADVPEAEDDPIYTLELDHTFAPFGILPQISDGDGDGDTAAPQPASPPAPELPVDEELVAAPAPDEHHEIEELAEPAPRARRSQAAGKASDMPGPSLLLRESGPSTVTMQAAPIAPPLAPPTPPRKRAAEARAARRSKLTPTRIEAPKLRVPESDEPEFVRRGRQRERSGKAVRIALAVGSLLLVLVLAAQAVSSFRNTLAARYPGMKPALVATCGVLGCRVELPAQIDQMAIETGELTTLGGNAYSFTTLLRNQGDSVQAWPSIELTLTDPDDKPLVRRVFGPRDYLPVGSRQVGPLLAAGFAARAEQPVKLNFRVEEPAPSGYHIAVFYP
ncbi:DUF3426 domain-containing protein [Massilia sp. H6]|uniref:DUF3426 domain-containing protein n=1 Tax=Massilia sp. H6 TaxID=2970464 RepID=UPI0021699D8C|nr:DUF3426 domain-containing protein [Massilia sp. H6]UVW28236.1 DUF3426 domain-containing protein [Massilia sp. H6]